MPSITQGLLKVLGNTNPSQHKCTSCGVSMPSYSGRYPSKCPSCGGDVKRNDGTPEEPDQPVSALADDILSRAKDNGYVAKLEMRENILKDESFSDEFDTRINNLDNMRVLYERKLAGVM